MLVPPVPDGTKKPGPLCAVRAFRVIYAPKYQFGLPT